MKPSSRRVFLGGSLSAAAALAWPARALAGKAPPPLPPFPLSVAVAEEAGEKVRDEAWITAQVAEAERLFSPLGVLFSKTPTRPLAASFARLESRDDRDALASQVVSKQINVMVVASLRDVDDPALYRMGVHWRSRKALTKHYVIVAASALPSTLAHELGHYFGLDHYMVQDNLMSYNRTGAPPYLNEAQKKRVVSMASMYIATKSIVPL